MNKKTLCIGLALLIILAVPLLIIPQMEDGIVKEVKARLDNYGATADLVEYDLLDDKLIIKNFAAKNIFFAKDSLNIAEIIAIAPNAKAFDSNIKELPLVAKELTFKNVTGSYEIDLLSAKFSTESIHVLNWKQNIAKLMELKKQDFTEEFFTALFNTTTESVTYINHNEESLTVEDGVSYKTISSAAKSQMTNIQFAHVEQYAVENIQYTSKRNDIKEYHSEAKNIVWDNISLPSPASLAYFAHILPKLNTDLPDEEAFKLMTHLEAATKLFSNTKISLTWLNTKQYKDQQAVDLLNLQSASFTTKIDEEKHSIADFDIKISGISVANEHLDLDSADQTMIVNLLGKTSLIDASLSLNLASQKPSNIALSFGVQHAANVDIKLDATLPKDVLPKLFSFNGKAFHSLATGEFLNWLEQAQFISFEADYVDSGLMPKSLLFFSNKQNQTPSSMWQVHAPFIKQLMAHELNNFKTQDLETIYECIEKPGTLALKIKPTNPMNFDDAIFDLIGNIQTMGLAVSCKPGTDIVKAATDFAK